MPEARHSLDRIVEPPRCTEKHRRIVTRERRQLSRVGRFVEREHDQLKARVISIRVEQWTQIACELSRDWNVATTIRSETPIYKIVVIAERTDVQLHHELVIQRHARHVHQ